MVSVVKLKDADEEKAKDIAMHVAAINPQYISQNEIPQEVRDREDAVQTEIMANDEKLKGKIFVIRPTKKVKISKIEKNPEKIEAQYQLGFKDALDKLDELKKYLEK